MFDRACIRRHLLEHLHPLLFSLICLSCFVTLGCFVNSCLLLAMLLFHGFLGPTPWLFVSVFSGPNPWLFYFLHGHLARVSFNQIVQYSADVLSLLHLLHHVVSTTRSTSSPSFTEVTSLVSSCTRQLSVFNAKTRSSVPSAPLNGHYQCTHEFSRVSGHFTHRWAYRHVYRKLNSLVVKISKLVHFQPDF